MSRQDDTTGHTDRRDQSRSRSSAEIEQDIANIRSRMDRTLDEIEYRLSPGQVTATVRDTFRDVIEGNPDNRIAMAIRRNPLPVALIGVGVAWLAVTVLREINRPTGVRPIHGAADPVAALAPLVQIAREGADALRAAEGATDDAAFRGVLSDYAHAQERSAVALETELRRHDPAAVLPAGAAGHPAWNELRRAVASRDRDAMIGGAEHGLAGMLDALRDALHDDLPEQTRVVVGSQFHLAEQMHNRLDALRQAA